MPNTIDNPSIQRRTTLNVAARAVRLMRSASGSRIVGYAAVFYNGKPETQYELWPGLVERIDRAAFDRAIREKQDVVGLFNHDANQVLGRVSAGTLKLSADAIGLKYEITVGQSSVAQDVYDFIKRREVIGSSFSFSSVQTLYSIDGELEVRTLLDVDLYDLGPVTWPAYVGTTAEASPVPDAGRNITHEYAERELLARRHEMDQSILQQHKSSIDAVNAQIRAASLTERKAPPDPAEAMLVLDKYRRQIEAGRLDDDPSHDPDDWN